MSQPCKDTGYGKDSFAWDAACPPEELACFFPGELGAVPGASQPSSGNNKLDLGWKGPLEMSYSTAALSASFIPQ